MGRWDCRPIWPVQPCFSLQMPAITFRDMCWWLTADGSALKLPYPKPVHLSKQARNYLFAGGAGLSVSSSALRRLERLLTTIRHSKRAHAAVHRGAHRTPPLCGKSAFKLTQLV